MKRALSVICVVALAGIANWGLRPSPFDSVNPLLSDGAPVHFLDGLDTESLPEVQGNRVWTMLSLTD
jgi:hypothetical protein